MFGSELGQRRVPLDCANPLKFPSCPRGDGACLLHFRMFWPEDAKGLTTLCMRRQDPHFIVLLSVVAALVPYNAVVLFKKP